MADKRTVRLKVQRQDTPGGEKRWEEFEVPWAPQMNIISALMEVQKNPTTVDGKKVAPIVWESSCLEEVCGACTMVINGRVRQACSALVEKLAPNGEAITISPMTKFPLVRDLVARFPTITWLLGHHEVSRMERTPIFRELDPSYRSHKIDPGDPFMAAVRAELADLGLRAPP